MTEKTKTILITGASSGIGEATALQLLNDNYHVIGIARDFTKSSIDHPAFTPVKIDLANTEALFEQLKKVDIKWDRINAIIFNAGKGHFGNLEQFSENQVRELMDLNFISQVILTKKILPLMKQKKAGDLIYIGSEAALSGSRQGSLYCASKFALRGFALSLRDECANTGIRVSLIHPGFVRTPFFDQLDFQPGPEPAHAINAEDVAKTVCFILQSRTGTIFDEITLSPQKKVIDFKK